MKPAARVPVQSGTVETAQISAWILKFVEVEGGGSPCIGSLKTNDARRITLRRTSALYSRRSIFKQLPPYIYAISAIPRGLNRPGPPNGWELSRGTQSGDRRPIPHANSVPPSTRASGGEGERPLDVLADWETGRVTTNSQGTFHGVRSLRKQPEDQIHALQFATLPATGTLSPGTPNSNCEIGVFFLELQSSSCCVRA